MRRHAERAGAHLAEQGEDARERSWWRFPPIRNALVSGLLLAVTFILARSGLIPGWAETTLYVVAAGFGASHWGREAVESVIGLRVNIDVLMGAATVGAAALGLWEEAAFLAFLYGGAEGLEELTYDRTRGAIRALLDLAPKEAHLLREGVVRDVPAGALEPGDRFLVRPGESLPTDGVIQAGETSLNEAPVTGESVPVEKGEGDQVFAGTVNLTGAIEVDATRAFSDNTLSRIIHLVEEAQGEKTGAQRFIDRFGDRYSPAILLGSLFLMVVPPLLGGDFREWATRAVTLAVAGAPCALVMSTPVAVAAAVGSAGRRGVLIKGGLHLENLGRITVVAFDKTGTLTRGEPVVTDVVAFDTRERADVLRLAASVESHSEHPLAGAIVRLAEAEGIARQPVASAQALAGAGAKAQVDGVEVFVGSPSLFQQMGTDLGPAVRLAEERFAEGKTVVLVGTAAQVLGLLALRDEPRGEAFEAVRMLHGEGIHRVAVLTGDNTRTGHAIAEALGLDEVKAELKPEDKSAAVRELQDSLGPLAMVGDGINDAPALATATVGIAMGTAGTDAAIEAADVALMGDDLRAVPYAVRLGRRARRISRQNIAFSILLLLVLVPSAVAGIINIAVAVTAHEVAEIIAVANGLRARVRR